MYKNRPFLLWMLTLLPLIVSAQISPKEGSSLNYRLIGFSVPSDNNRTKYTLEIAEGNISNSEAFRKGLIASITCDSNKIIEEVPEFGHSYTWRMTASNQTGGSELHHFSTQNNPDIDTTKRRLRVTIEAEEYSDAYLFVDCMHALFSMDGKPVWFLPQKNFSTDSNANTRDLKMTPQGTITFISGDKIYEINYDGQILWQGPNTGEVSGENTEYYHHEFTRLTSGHYMTMGNQILSWKLSDFKPDSLNQYKADNISISPDGSFYQKLHFGTIIEYDTSGKVVWSWKSSDYFMNSDVMKHKDKSGKFDAIDGHSNSFFFDERNKLLYVSFRDLSRIVKIKYPEKKIIAEYGLHFEPGINLGNEFFSGQHSVRISKDGYLYVFNNNPGMLNDLPKLVMLRETSGARDLNGLKKIWEYECTSDGMSDREVLVYQKRNERLQKMKSETGAKRWKHTLTSGGNIQELPDGSVFASTATPISKLFIVSKNKIIQWCAITEQHESTDSSWTPFPTYRAYIIPDKHKLDRLIWNSLQRQ